MSEGIKGLQKPKRIIKKIMLDGVGAHMAMTDASQGGPASMKGDILFKASSNTEVPLTEAQKEILAYIGEEPTPLEKSNGVDNQSSNQDGKSTPSPSTEESTGGVNSNLNKGNEMSDEIKALEAKLAAAEAVNAELQKSMVSKDLAVYSFDEDLLKSVSAVICGVKAEDKEVILKGFNVLLASKEAVEADLAKAKEASHGGGSDLAKALSQEQGHSDAGEVIEKTFAQEVEELTKAKLEGAK